MVKVLFYLLRRIIPYKIERQLVQELKMHCKLLEQPELHSIVLPLSKSKANVLEVLTNEFVINTEIGLKLTSQVDPFDLGFDNPQNIGWG